MPQPLKNTTKKFEIRQKKEAAICRLFVSGWRGLLHLKGTFQLFRLHFPQRARK